MAAILHSPVGSAEVRTPLLGEGNVVNILAAVTVALRFQVPLEAVLATVATFATVATIIKITRIIIIIGRATHIPVWHVKRLFSALPYYQPS